MPADRAPRPDAVTIVVFGAAVVLGAGNFLAVRLSNLDLPPFWGAGLRFGIAAVSFVMVCLAMRLPWPRGRELAVTLAYGLLSFGAFYALMYWALVRVTAGVAVIVMAIVPLATLLLAVAQRLERATVRNAAGALLALAGIAWIGSGGQVELPATALVAMLLAAAVAGEGIILGKRVSANHPATTNAVGMTAGAAALLLLSAATGETWALPTQAEAVWAVAYLVTFGSMGLFVLVLLVVRRWTASASSYLFVLFPVVTIALEAWLLDEPVTGRAVVGALLVMAGVWFGALAPAARRSAAAAAARTVAEDPDRGGVRDDVTSRPGR